MQPATKAIRPRIDPPKRPKPETCPTCFKSSAYCLCAEMPKISARQEILILQHPQEPDHDLGSARLCALALDAQLRVGLSWPNLSKALGRVVDPKKWGVLYLGAGPQGRKLQPGVHFVNKKGEPLPPTLPMPKVEGWVVLDGTWSQAKTLWWRNAWLLKLPRAVLVPREQSMYGKLRKEPKRECLSTLEAVAETLELNGSLAAADATQLRTTFAHLLERARAAKAGNRTRAPIAPAATEAPQQK